MAFRYLSATNGFLPVATGQVVGFIRDPKKYALTRYVENVRSPAPTASYLKLDRGQSQRIVSEKSFAWQDGDPRPTGHHNLATHRWVAFQTERRAYPFTLGNQAIKTAQKIGKWDPLTAMSRIVANQAMVLRTQRIIDMLETASNWTNTSSAASLGGGHWGLASSEESDPYHAVIFKSLMAAVEVINKETNGVVRLEDLKLVINPTAARKMATTGEIRAYMKGSPTAQIVLQGASPFNPNEQWGLPAKLYGIEVVVEDTVRVTNHPYAGGEDTTADTRTFAKDTDSAVLVSRPGAIDGTFGSPSYSTVQCYWYSENGEDGGELEVESRVDSWDRFTEGSCVEQFAEVLAAEPSGYFITDLFSDA